MGTNTERESQSCSYKMNSIVSITIASLAMVNAASLPTSNGTDPRINWINVCDYSDPFGAKCCAPGMEGHQYLVVPENVGWTNHALQCQLFGGWLTILETKEEWACIEHWVENAYNPAFQRFAISLRADFTHPDYEEWATSHPQDGDCVSMTIGSGVDHQGQWVDGDCINDVMWAICEKM